MTKVAEIELSSMTDPVRVALRGYQDRTNGAVVFDIDRAADLEPTPDKPNSARSATPVLHKGEEAGTLYTIVFDVEDGTGDETTFRLTDSMSNGLYPLEPKVVPRSKAGIHSEAHLALASFFAYRDLDPIMHANHLDLVGFHDGRLARLAYLGQSAYNHTLASIGEMELEPTATLTTGFLLDGGERFGDPHSVFNSGLFVQVAAFLAITDAAAGQHLDVLNALGAVEPDLAPWASSHNRVLTDEVTSPAQAMMSDDQRSREELSRLYHQAQDCGDLEAAGYYWPLVQQRQ